MDCSDTNGTPAAAATSTLSPPSPPLAVSPSSTSSPPTAVVVASPCAACKILRRRCAEKCVLAPYFPPTDPLKFTIAHRVFGASNIIKFLQELPESQRADAVSSMVYEANARIRDPVYGCAGSICQLQKQVNELQAQLAKAQAEIINMQCQQANLLALIYMAQSSPPHVQQQQPSSPSFDDTGSDDHMGSPDYNTNINHDVNYNSSCFIDDNGLGSMWEPLWT